MDACLQTSIYPSCRNINVNYLNDDISKGKKSKQRVQTHFDAEKGMGDPLKYIKINYTNAFQYI